MSDISWAGATRCWDCGRMVNHKPNGGPQRHHLCRLRWITRIRWAADRGGWHSGYRFAVEHMVDPMVLADAEDYGSGWAGLMRAGGATVLAADESEQSA